MRLSSQKTIPCGPLPQAGKCRKKNGYIACGHDIVTWCFGHLLEMDRPEAYDEKYKGLEKEDLPILPETFQTSVRKMLQHR